MNPEKQEPSFKMGSLFDGSGGFPLASALCGIEPVWASEIEPFPIKVTKARFPNMKHYGDISKIDVNELETVDLITGGSPCQDMSVAGKRQGMSKKCPKCSYTVVGNAEITECPECGAELEYTRSGLFMDQIRIVKEMRKKDELEQLRSGRTDKHIRPRFMLWENVTGAFSSNKGEDFRAVLEETAKIKDPAVIIPRPPKGKWNNSGLIMGDGYSIAWRVFDAQYWGVPQRRRRIALVADFGGQSAGEILFERDGLRRNFTESKKAWQGIAGYLAESIGEAGEHIGFDMYNQSITGDKARTLKCPIGGDDIPCVFSSEPITYNGENLTSPLNKQDPKPGDPCHTLGTDPRNYALIPQQYSVDFGRTADRIQMNADKSVTLLGEVGGAGAKTGLYCLPVINRPIPIQDQAISNGSGNGLGIGKENDPMYTLMADTQHGIAYSLQGNMIGREDHNGPQGSGVNEDVSFTLNTTDRHAVCYDCRNFKANSKVSGTLQAKSNGGQSLNYINPVCVEKNTFRMEAFGQHSESDKDSCLKSRDYKDATDLIADMIEYIVRRLTPLECSRLQGFPDWWCDGLQVENPTEEDLAFWREVFETHREIVTGASKAKTDKQIIKWLEEEPNDGAMYKMWGNGIALPCFLYVTEGIKEILERTPNDKTTDNGHEDSPSRTDRLKVLDLFSGTQSVAKAFRSHGHETYTVELDKQHPGIDWYADIMDITAADILSRFGRPDVIWASPPCEKFSVAAIGKHWIEGTNDPKTEDTKKALALLEHTVKLIKELNPTYYFIENPRGKMRKMQCMADLPRYTVTYCKYGDTRMKPTDIWTNHPEPGFKPPCKNGDTCHERAPRGSRTGTQGIKGAVERSRIPQQLCEHIVEICEKQVR